MSMMPPLMANWTTFRLDWQSDSSRIFARPYPKYLCSAIDVATRCDRFFSITDLSVDSLAFKSRRAHLAICHSVGIKSCYDAHRVFPQCPTRRMNGSHGGLLAARS